VKLTTAVAPEQIVVAPDIAAVGNGNTVTTALPDAVLVQAGVVVAVTLTKA